MHSGDVFEILGFLVGQTLADHEAMLSKHVVYILRSTKDRRCYYVGVTSNVDTRLATHNSGGSHHTARDRPWELVVSLKFADAGSALAFERYLKTGSGRAFAKRHFI